MYIKPGGPLDNGCIESFVERFEDGLLKGEWFENVYRANVLVEGYRLGYNHKRSHSSLYYMTSVAFIVECTGQCLLAIDK